MTMFGMLLFLLLLILVADFFQLVLFAGPMVDFPRPFASHAPLQLTMFDRGPGSNGESQVAAAKAAPVAPLLALPAPPLEPAQPSALETKQDSPASDKGVKDEKVADTSVVVPTSTPGTAEINMVLETGRQVELSKEGVEKIEAAPAEGVAQQIPPQAAVARLQEALVKRQDGSKSDDQPTTKNCKMKRPASASAQKSQGPPMKKPAAQKAEEKDVIPKGHGKPVPSKSRRIKMMPRGCSTSRYIAGCTPSCWRKEGLGRPLDLEGMKVPHVQMFGSGFREKDAAEWKLVCLADFVCPLLKSRISLFKYLKTSSMFFVEGIWLKRPSV